MLSTCCYQAAPTGCAGACCRCAVPDLAHRVSTWTAFCLRSEIHRDVADGVVSRDAVTRVGLGVQRVTVTVRAQRSLTHRLLPVIHHAAWPDGIAARHLEACKQRSLGVAGLLLLAVLPRGRQRQPTGAPDPTSVWLTRCPGPKHDRCTLTVDRYSLSPSGTGIL